MINLISSNNYLYRFLRSSAFVISIFDFTIFSNYILYILGSNPKLIYTDIIFVITASIVL
jgi:hypothetical protein